MARGSGQTRDDGCVFVGELPDEEDSGRFSGLFAAHWERESDRGFRDGPEGVSVEEAIRWGRRQAPMVLVRIGDDHFYSAGPEVIDDDDVQPWPAGGIRVEPRPVGTPFDGSVQVVQWAVAIDVDLEGDDRDRVFTAVEAAEAVEVVRAGKGGGRQVVVKAPGVAGAAEKVYAVLMDALDDVVGRSKRRSTGFDLSVEEMSDG